jgi:hypothetical protein
MYPFPSEICSSTPSLSKTTFLIHRKFHLEQFQHEVFIVFQNINYNTDRAAAGSDNMAIVYLHFLTTNAGVSPTDAPCLTSSSHCHYQN